MLIARQNIVKSFLFHRNERNAIRERPIFTIPFAHALKSTIEKPGTPNPSANAAAVWPVSKPPEERIILWRQTWRFDADFCSVRQFNFRRQHHDAILNFAGETHVENTAPIGE